MNDKIKNTHNPFSQGCPKELEKLIRRILIGKNDLELEKKKKIIEKINKKIDNF